MAQHSLAGTFLVASPVLMDPNFLHTVVYLVEHNEGGALGLIVNRPLDIALGDVWPDCPRVLAEEFRCGEGGPVERDRAILLHACSEVIGSHRLTDGLAVGGDEAAIADAVSKATNERLLPRLFLGHSGWAPNQLEQELQRGGWLQRRAHPRWVLGVYDPEELWTDLVQCGNAILEPSPN